MSKKASLKVSAIQGKDISPENCAPTSVLFAAFRIGKTRLKTKESNQIPNPQWKEEFTFSVEDPSKNELFVEIFDIPSFLAGKPLGSTKIMIRDLPASKDKTEWYLIEKSDKNQGKNETLGEIELTLRAEGFGVEQVDEFFESEQSSLPTQEISLTGTTEGTTIETTNEEFVPTEINEETPSNGNNSEKVVINEEDAAFTIQQFFKNNLARKMSVGKLEVTLIEAKDLIPADSNGTSNPYVEFVLGKSSTKSKPVEKTLSPKWRATFHLWVSNPETDQLEANIYHKDTNVKLGSVVISLRDLVRHHKLKKWYPIQAPKGSSQQDSTQFGELHLELLPLDFGLESTHQTNIDAPTLEDSNANPSKETEPIITSFQEANRSESNSFASENPSQLQESLQETSFSHDISSTSDQIQKDSNMEDISEKQLDHPEISDTLNKTKELSTETNPKLSPKDFSKNEQIETRQEQDNIQRQNTKETKDNDFLNQFLSETENNQKRTNNESISDQDLVQGLEKDGDQDLEKVSDQGLEENVDQVSDQVLDKDIDQDLEKISDQDLEENVDQILGEDQDLDQVSEKISDEDQVSDQVLDKDIDQDLDQVLEKDVDQILGEDQDLEKVSDQGLEENVDQILDENQVLNQIFDLESNRVSDKVSGWSYAIAAAVTVAAIISADTLHMILNSFINM